MDSTAAGDSLQGEIEGMDEERADSVAGVSGRGAVGKEIVDSEDLNITLRTGESTSISLSIDELWNFFKSDHPPQIVQVLFEVPGVYFVNIEEDPKTIGNPDWMRLWATAIKDADPMKTAFKDGDAIKDGEIIGRTTVVCNLESITSDSESDDSESD